MICDIFVRSYWRDMGWLELCLAAIAKHARGFRSVVLVVPGASEPWLRRLPPLAENVRVELCDDYADDYLGQQVSKLYADHYSDADVIVHLDADCIVSEPMQPEHLVTEGRPHIAMCPSARLGRHWPWRRPTEEFLGWEVAHDYMQRPPFVYPRWLYGELRAHALAVHRTDLTTYVASRPPRGFSEFNALGAYAAARHPEHFLWIDTTLSTLGPPRCRWYSSWEGVESARSEIEAILCGTGHGEASDAR